MLNLCCNKFNCNKIYSERKQSSIHMKSKPHKNNHWHILINTVISWLIYWWNSIIRVIQVPVGVSQSISIESHFASAAPCSSALGEFIVLRVEHWMTDSCPSSQQKPQKSSSSTTWLWSPSSSGLSSAAASQVKSRESNSSPLWTSVPLKWSPQNHQNHDAALCFCLCILRVQRPDHSDSACSSDICSGRLRNHQL